MKLNISLLAVAVCAIALPLASSASVTKQDRTNGARACTALRAGLGATSFGLTYGTTAARSDARGKCVSAWTAAAATARRASTNPCKARMLKGAKLAACIQASTKAKLNARVSATKNAAKVCAAERTSLGAGPFAAKYGTNANKSNAFGKCVSSHAKAANGGGVTKTRYRVTLSALNNSGVIGDASLTLSGDQLTVVLHARNLEASKEHMQHIHGLASGTATCPTSSADTNSDGTITLQEGLPFYGGILQNLSPFPTANASGNISYSETLTVSTATLGALETRTIVLHGKTVGGSYDMTLPVACGQITKG
jgi:hypothetical protein